MQHLVGSEGKESKKVSYDRKVSSKKYSARLTGFRKEFLARPRKTGGHRHKQGTDRELISFRTLGEKDEFNSYGKYLLDFKIVSRQKNPLPKICIRFLGRK